MAIRNYLADFRILRHSIPQNHKDQQKEAVDVVDFIVPDAREHKVGFDEDGSERE